MFLDILAFTIIVIILAVVGFLLILFVAMTIEEGYGYILGLLLFIVAGIWAVLRLVGAV